MKYALVSDTMQPRCHCISVRDTVDDLLEIPVEGRVRIVPIPDSIARSGDAVSQYCDTHKGERI